MIFLNEDQRIALSAGSSWHENHRGTNAIGTVLVEQSAITVQGAEHFMSQRHVLAVLPNSRIPAFIYSTVCPHRQLDLIQLTTQRTPCAEQKLYSFIGALRT